MSKVLLLDSAFSSMPIYNYLLNQAHDVYVMGNRANDAIAIKAGEKWIHQDYSQVSQVKKIFSDYNFDYIVPGCTDLSLEICLQITEHSDTLDSPSVYQHIGDKEKFRNLCKSLHIASPQKVDIKDFPKNGQYIIKPVDAYSGNGISTVDGNDIVSVTQADQAAKAASPTQRSLCEEFIEGQLYSYSCFLNNQKVSDDFIVIEGSSSNPFAVDTSYVVHDFAIEIQSKLKQDVEAIADHLKLVNGLFHLQFILYQDTPYFIEATRRCPGDLYSKLIEYSTNFNYAGKFASYFVKETLQTVSSYKHGIIRHTVSSSQQSNFETLEFINSVNVKAFYPLLGLGSVALPNQKTRIGILFLEDEVLDTSYQHLINRKNIKLS